MKTLCVFSGSSFGRGPVYTAAARRLGGLLAERGYNLVYGGGNVGLMGEVSRAVLEKGGRVVGVIPEYIRSRVPHVDLSELIVTPGMHERKAKMYELSDGFVALPGGIGTLEETAEIFTWGQLGHHGKPVGLLNVGGFYDSLLAFLEHAVREGFLKKTHFDNLIVSEDPGDLLDRFAAYRHRREDKWRSCGL
jgi:hypothetical protein